MLNYSFKMLNDLLVVFQKSNVEQSLPLEQVLFKRKKRLEYLYDAFPY